MSPLALTVDQDTGGKPQGAFLRHFTLGKVLKALPRLAHKRFAKRQNKGASGEGAVTPRKPPQSLGRPGCCSCFGKAHPTQRPPLLLCVCFSDHLPCFLGTFSPQCAYCCSVANLWTLRPHGLQHARLPGPPLSPRVCSNSGPLTWGLARCIDVSEAGVGAPG